MSDYRAPRYIPVEIPMIGDFVTLLYSKIPKKYINYHELVHPDRMFKIAEIYEKELLIVFGLSSNSTLIVKVKKTMVDRVYREFGL